MTNNHLLLYRLTELMLDKQQHILALDDLFEDEQIGAFVRSIQIDSPYQQLIFEGVLTETIKEERVMVTFTVEGYFHYVLGEEIEKQTLDKGAEALKELLENTKLRGITEGVEQCLVRDVEKNDLSRMMWLIDEGGKALDASAYPLAQAFSIIEGNPKTEEEKEEASKKQIEKVMDELLADPTDNDYLILDKSIDIIRGNSNEVFINKLYLHLWEINNTKNNFSYNAIKVLIDASIILTIKQSSSFFDSQITKIKSFNNDDKTRLYFSFYKILSKKGNFKEAVEFAKQFDLYSSETIFIRNHYYDILYPLLELGDFKQADDLYQKMKIYFSNDGEFINWSGWIYQSWYELKSNDISHLKKGLKLYLKSTDLIEKEFGKFSLKKYENLENIGYTYSLMNQPEMAIKHLDEAIKIQTNCNNSKTVYTLGNTYEMKAGSLLKLKHFNEALEMMDRADSCKLLRVDSNSTEMAWNYETRANILIENGEKNQALELLNKVYKIRLQKLGKDNQQVLETKRQIDKIILKNE